ncbi:MAG: right-handed parallel beta-helix repeat-containing protein [bacterium]|nr:right-handed parallel beta-helix repeat-containing protein [bacterium]
MQSKFIKILAAILLIPILYGLGVYVARGEVRTDAEYPESFQNAAAFCAGNDAAQVLKFSPGQEQEIQAALNSLTECTTIQLAAGRFVFNNALTIAGVDGITLAGAGQKATTIQFVDAINVNGVDVESANQFTIRDLKIVDSPKNAVEIRLSENIHIDRVTTTWSITQGPERGKNGAYGFYPVNVSNVLLENSESFYASDAGIYVGQCINAVVRNNLAEQNVMGLEIENTVNAEVYDNVVKNNTGGLLVYDLNKNTIVTRNVRVHRNTVVDNNNDNFSNAGIVKSVPAGVGFIITAAREVEIFDNTFGNNNTTDIALFSGLITETPDFGEWAQNNFRLHSIYIHDNIFNGGSGDSIDNGRTNVESRPLGKLMESLFQIWNEERASAGGAALKVPNISYDGVDKGRTLLVLTNTMFGNQPGNHNQICLKDNDRGAIQPTLGDYNMPALLNNSAEPTDESMRAAIQAGEVVVYENGEDGYGGAPEAGFACEGFRATGVPVNFPAASAAR